MLNQNIPPFLAVFEKQNITVPSLENSNKLLKPNSYLCDLKSPKLSNSIQSCELAIVRNSSNMAKTFCKYVEAKLPYDFYSTYLETKWYAFFGKETIATVTRLEQANNRLLQKYLGT